MIANIATVAAVIFAAFALRSNAKAVKVQKDVYKIDLFHKISSEINIIFSQQKEFEALGDDAILNWYQRLMNEFEYYAFFVNRKYLIGEMATFYRGSIITYVDWAKEYAKAEEFFKNKDTALLCEVRQYYEKYSGKPFPF